MYFVTACTQDRKSIFGEINSGVMHLNDIGKMVECIWNSLSGRFHNIELDEFIVMPHHIHGIISIAKQPSNVGAGLPRPGAETAPLRPVTLSKIVAYLKYQSTKLINNIRKTPGISIWQRNYHERVIRNEKELLEIRQYIQNNPLKWNEDPENIALHTTISSI